MVPRKRRSPRQRSSRRRGLSNRVGTHSSTAPHSSFPRRLPPSRKPVQVQTCRESREQELAEAHWVSTDAGTKYARRFLNLSSRHSLAHSRELTKLPSCSDSSGHVQLRKHFYRSQLPDSPRCAHCGQDYEPVSHLLLRCSHFAVERHDHHITRGPDLLSLSFLLHAPMLLAHSSAKGTSGTLHCHVDTMWLYWKRVVLGVGKHIINVPSCVVCLDSQYHIDFGLTSPCGGGRRGRVHHWHKRAVAAANKDAGGDEAE